MIPVENIPGTGEGGTKEMTVGLNSSKIHILKELL
jgi:hypothetical protein